MKIHFKMPPKDMQYINFLVGLTGKTVNKFAEHAFITSLAAVEEEFIKRRQQAKAEEAENGATAEDSGQAQVGEASGDIQQTTGSDVSGPTVQEFVEKG